MRCIDTANQNGEGTRTDLGGAGSITYSEVQHLGPCHSLCGHETGLLPVSLILHLLLSLGSANLHCSTWYLRHVKKKSLITERGNMYKKSNNGWRGAPGVALFQPTQHPFSLCWVGDGDTVTHTKKFFLDQQQVLQEKLPRLAALVGQSMQRLPITKRKYDFVV